jgi:hypothetical protein
VGQTHQSDSPNERIVHSLPTLLSEAERLFAVQGWNDVYFVISAAIALTGIRAIAIEWFLQPLARLVIYSQEDTWAKRTNPTPQMNE